MRAVAERIRARAEEAKDEADAALYNRYAISQCCSNIAVVGGVSALVSTELVL
jgi:hypothetical protein